MIPLLLDFLSAYRLTRLITADTILDGPRDALVKWSYERAQPRRFRDDGDGDFGDFSSVIDGSLSWTDFAMDDPDAPKLSTLAWCRFCAGFWCSVLVVVARRRFPRQWAPIAEALALSAGAALIAGLED